MNHATDPDHVVAVTTILSRERRIAAAARIGIVWGLGHSATVVAVGSAIILLKITIPARIGLAMEFAVGVVLIMLGIPSLRGIIRFLVDKLVRPVVKTSGPIAHSHPHSHGGVVHTHPHVHQHMDSEGVRLHDHFGDPPSAASSGRPLLRSFGVGLVHGLAGSAAIALLALSAIPSPTWAAAYLAVFCVGTICGMLLITVAVAIPFTLASARLNVLHRVMQSGAGLISFGFGLLLVWQIAAVDHLFGPAPTWSPH
jgi:high-affinity nickel-transport protein